MSQEHSSENRPPQPGYQNYAPYPDDEIDLRELFAVIWKGRYWVVAITATAAMISLIVALSLPNIYRSEALLAPAENESGGGLSGLASQYGGLAAMAGINLGGSSSRVDEGLAVLKSRKFIGEFIERHDLRVPLMAVENWSATTNELIIDPKVYDVKARRWVREVEPPLTPKPSAQEAYRKFIEGHLSVSVDSKSNFVTLAIEHVSPSIAQQWVTWLVNDLNNVIKIDDVSSAERSIAYLQRQLEQTAIADLQSVFYQLIEGQMKTIMLANGREEYLFRTLDPSVVPEEKVKPKRALICVLGTLLGGMLSLGFVFFLNYHRKYSVSAA